MTTKHCPAAILVAFLLAFSVFAQAQEAAPSPISIAFVDAQALIRAHPAGRDVQELGSALQTEVDELVTQAQDLMQKRQTQGLNAEEEELLQALTTTIRTRQETGRQELFEAAAPAEEAATALIAEIAEREGYSLVLDLGAVAENNLVPYASESMPDITAEAIRIMEERYPAE